VTLRATLKKAYLISIMIYPLPILVRTVYYFVLICMLASLFVGCGRDVVAEKFPNDKPKVIRTYGWLGSQTRNNLKREIVFYSTGNKETDTQFKKGERHGPYSNYWQNGHRKTEGQFVHGKKEGEWKFYFNQFTVSAMGVFKNNLKEGLWRQYWENGEPRAEGNFHLGKEIGTYKEWTNKGEPVLENACFELNEQGRYRNFYVNKQIKEDYNCHFGVPVGAYVKKDPDGVVIEKGNFDSLGRKEGVWETFINGNLSVTLSPVVKASLKHYHEGIENDSSYAWYASGQIKERGFFVSGVGERLGYDSLGHLIERQHLVQGRPEGEVCTYFPSGGKHSLVIYKAGVPTEQHSWHQNGKLRSEGSFQAGKRVGIWKQYHDNGKLAEVSPYQDGVLHGEQIFYDKEGKTTQTLRYEHGYPAEGKIPASLAAGIANLKKKSREETKGNVEGTGNTNATGNPEITGNK